MRRTRISVADKLLYEYFFFSDFCSGYHENHTKQSELINPYKGLAKRKATSLTKPWFKISILNFASISQPNKPIANCLRAISRPWHYESVISLFLAGVTLINIHKPFPTDPRAPVHLIASWSDLLNAIKSYYTGESMCESRDWEILPGLYKKKKISVLNLLFA